MTAPRTLLVGLLSAGVVACQGTGQGTEVGNPNASEVGNPNVQGRVAGGSWSSDLIEVRPGAGGRIQVDRAWLWVDDLRFRTQSDCDDADNSDDDDLQLSTVFELIGGSSVSMDLEKTEYCELRLELGQDNPPTAPPDMDVVTMVVEGSLDDGTPFRVVSGDRSTVRLEGAFPVSKTAADLALGFDLAVWFDDVDLAALPLDAGVLLLDEESDADMLERFEDNLEPSIALFADTDGDGALDPEEAAATPLAEPQN